MPEYTRLVNRRLVLNIPFTKYKKVPYVRVILNMAFVKCKLTKSSVKVPFLVK